MRVLETRLPFPCLRTGSGLTCGLPTRLWGTPTRLFAEEHLSPPPPPGGQGRCWREGWAEGWLRSPSPALAGPAQTPSSALHTRRPLILTAATDQSLQTGDLPATASQSVPAGSTLSPQAARPTRQCVRQRAEKTLATEHD